MKFRIIEGLDYFLTDESADGSPTVMIEGKPHKVFDKSRTGETPWDLVFLWLSSAPRNNTRWCQHSPESRKLAHAFLRGDRTQMTVTLQVKNGTPVATLERMYDHGVEMTPSELKDFARTLMLIAGDCEKYSTGKPQMMVYKLLKHF